MVVGAETYSALPDGTRVQLLGGVRVKGKQVSIEAYVVFELPPYGTQHDQRPHCEHPETGG